jgi:hypothetical protein
MQVAQDKQDGGDNAAGVQHQVKGGVSCCCSVRIQNRDRAVKQDLERVPKALYGLDMLVVEGKARQPLNDNGYIDKKGCVIDKRAGNVNEFWNQV